MRMKKNNGPNVTPKKPKSETPPKSHVSPEKTTPLRAVRKLFSFSSKSSSSATGDDRILLVPVDSAASISSPTKLHQRRSSRSSTSNHTNENVNFDDAFEHQSGGFLAPSDEKISLLDLFDSKRFLSSRHQEDKPFFQALIQSQMFEVALVQRDSQHMRAHILYFILFARRTSRWTTLPISTCIRCLSLNGPHQVWTCHPRWSLGANDSAIVRVWAVANTSLKIT